MVQDSFDSVNQSETINTDQSCPNLPPQNSGMKQIPLWALPEHINSNKTKLLLQ